MSSAAASKNFGCCNADPIFAGRAGVTAVLIYGGAIRNRAKRLFFNNIIGGKRHLRALRSKEKGAEVREWRLHLEVS